METTPEDNKKAAKKAYNQEYRRKNALDLKNKKIAYYEAHKCYIKEKSKTYRVKNPEKLKEYLKGYNKKHIDDKKIYNREYYKDNREECKKAAAKYRENNKKSLQESRRIYRLKNKANRNAKFLEKYNNDILFKIQCNLRSRFKMALKAQGVKKTQKIDELVGCSVDFFKNIIALQFKTGMSWENHGLKSWHLDHIQPCASFDLSIIEEQKKCFHYTNFQPLWWWENLEKSDKINREVQ